MRVGLLRHWEINDQLGAHFPIFGEALKARRLVASTEELASDAELWELGNWARHSPPPAAPPPAPRLAGGCSSHDLERFRSTLYGEHFGGGLSAELSKTAASVDSAGGSSEEQPQDTAEDELNVVVPARPGGPSPLTAASSADAGSGADPGASEVDDDFGGDDSHATDAEACSEDGLAALDRAGQGLLPPLAVGAGPAPGGVDLAALPPPDVDSREALQAGLADATRAMVDKYCERESLARKVAELEAQPTLSDDRQLEHWQITQELLVLNQELQDVARLAVAYNDQLVELQQKEGDQGDHQ